MRKSITYFETKGKANTEEVFSLVRERAQELGIRDVVFPTTTGETALRAGEKLEGLRAIGVTHSTGRREPGHQEVSEQVRNDLKAAGVEVLTATQAFGGVGRSVRKRFDTWQTEEIIAHTLKRMAEGYKVAVEVTLMAADAGLVSPDDEIIACGGTGRGLDTAIVLKPTHAQTFFDLKVLELICNCLLYTSDAADDLTRVDLGGRRIIKKKKKKKKKK